MKTILAGTDFTSSSVNACRYAALVAQKLNCKLVVFNFFDTPVLHTNSGLMDVSLPTLFKDSQRDVKKIVAKLSLEFPGIRVSGMSRPGGVKNELRQFIDQHRVEAVVMGLAAKSKLSKFIYGSE